MRTTAAILALCVSCAAQASMRVMVFDTPYPGADCARETANHGTPVAAAVALLAAGCATWNHREGWARIYVPLGPARYVHAALTLYPPDYVLGHELFHALYGDFHAPDGKYSDAQREARQ